MEKEFVFADFHIHSRFSRATSKNITLENLESSAKTKGLNLLGTGDFTHPKWFSELSQLREEDGILKTKKGFSFILQSEISLIYSKDDKLRRIHHVLLSPDLDTTKQINEHLATKGILTSDGRPIFGKYSNEELVEDLKNINSKIEIIPAHIWTPWFSVFGSKSGFDSIKQAFTDKASHIHALETGLSSDPQMNHRISALDKYNLVSNSDSHSYHPHRIGREATIFKFNNLSYNSVLNAIRHKTGLDSTIEVDPGYGKYHLDGHRKCNVCFNPEESKKENNICPVCRRELTLGVSHRIEELADRPKDYIKKDAPGFYKLIPLSEIISFAVNCGISTKKVNQIYYKLIDSFENEFNILLKIPIEEIKKIYDNEIFLKLIKLNRIGKIPLKEGYDGVYGEIDREKIKNPNKITKKQEPFKKTQKAISDYF
jgi:uncharacterized protein (TIGR00375 family)